MKKIVRVLVLAFCICMLAIMGDNAHARIYTGDIKSEINALKSMSAYMPGNQNPPSALYRSGTQGCFGFVDLLCREIYGHNLASQKSAMELNASNNFMKIGSTLSQASGNLSANSLKDLFQNCVVGDVVQMDYTTYAGGDSRHTMMIYSVSSNGVVFYHAGSSNIYFGASTGTQPLWGTAGRELTWAQLVACLSSGDDGISVYRSTSVDTGTHTHNWEFRYFYAVHPHHNSYVCSTCGAEMDDANSSNYWSDCSICTQPGSSTISTSSLSVYVDTKVNFSWTASSNTTKYNLKYFDSANNYVTIATITGTSYEYIFTKPGQYGVYVDSLNDNGQYAQSNVLWIEVKEKAHEHNWEYRYYHSAHPHHNSYICTTCNAEKDDMNSSNFSNVCDTCLDEVMKKRVRLKGHTYDLYMASTTWEKAKEFCQKKGGHLVTITEATEAETVYSLTGGAYCWLGGYRDEDTRWRWITGENFAFSDWSQNEPNNYGGNENYIGTSVTNKWNDYPNSDQAVVGFVCEYEPIVIAFDMNGGQGGMAPILKGYDESVNLYEYAPTRAGYKFAGWSRDKGAQLGQYWYGSLCDVNESITLYAIWEKSHITVVYDATNKILYQKCVLDGVNKNRNLAEVILYTSDYGTTSMTNEYGTEVSVDSLGKVIDKVYGVGSAKIPKGGFVVSAHASQDNVFVWDCIDVGDYIYYDAAEQSIYVFAEQEKMTNFKHCKVNGHTEAKMPAKAPTTKKVGLTEGVKCANCGIVLKKQMTIAKIKSPKATTIKKCSSSKKTITVKFKKCSNIAGYKIQLATQKNMKKGVKTYNVQKNKNKYVIRKLKRNKKYYVRIRTFKKVNGKKIYSKWSKKVMVKTR